MADDQSSSKEVNGGGEGNELSYDDETVTTAVAESIKTTAVVDDYPEEPIEDYVVNLVVNEQPDGGITPSTNIIDAAITDIQDSMTPSKTSAIVDKINEYVTTAVEELSSDTTPVAITDGKRWWGWSTQKLLLVGLIALCVLAILIVILCVVFGKKFKKTKKTPATAGTTGTTKAVVTKGISPDPKYQPVPNV
ncbi:unnamed protein product [Rotaria sp. Silwood1]|nr:unnamed protein product [Rotaria sp. Silwood1]CAF4588828.1 unnamed protein product [Rotaria sp. Silwood1]